MTVYETYESSAVPIKAFTRGVFVKPKSVNSRCGMSQG